MPHEVVAPSFPQPRLVLVFAELADIGIEYVMAQRWPQYQALLAAASGQGPLTAVELEDLLARLSFASRPLLVKDCWKPFRKGIFKLALALGLEEENV